MSLPVTVCCGVVLSTANSDFIDAMDPDIEIMHVVSVNELKPSSLITVNLSPDYNRKIPNCHHLPDERASKSKKINDDNDQLKQVSDITFLDIPIIGSRDSIDSIWKERQLHNPRLFNATKFRVHRVISSDDEKHVVMFLGITDYKDYLGTNWAPNVKALQGNGVALHNNSQVFLSDAMGVGASVITKDNCIILLWRSQHCAEAPEMWDVPGGHAEPKKIIGEKLLEEIDVSSMNKSAVVDEIFHSIVQEVVDEVNIPVDHLDPPMYMGAHRNTISAGRPSLAFAIRCSLSSDDIRAVYSQGNQQEADESTNITFVPVQEIATLETDKQDLWNKMAPSAKGNLTVFSLTHGFKKL